MWMGLGGWMDGEKQVRSMIVFLGGGDQLKTNLVKQ